MQRGDWLVSDYTGWLRAACDVRAIWKWVTLPAAEGAVGGPTGVEKVYLDLAPERSEVVDSAVRLSCDFEDGMLLSAVLCSNCMVVCCRERLRFESCLSLSLSKARWFETARGELATNVHLHKEFREWLHVQIKMRYR